VIQLSGAGDRREVALAEADACCTDRSDLARI
jgi:hypothetical protein